VSVFAYSDRNFAVLSTGQLVAWGNVTNVDEFQSYAGVGKVRYGKYLVGDYPQAAAPTIVSFENRQRRRTGARVRLSCGVTGSLPLYFQWYKDGGAITDATNNTYGIEGVSAADAGLYSLEISNQFGSTRTAESLLEVLAEPEPAITTWITNAAATGPGSFG